MYKAAVVVSALALSLSGCGTGPVKGPGAPQEFSKPNICDKLGATDHCLTVWIRKDTATGKDVVSVDPDSLTLTGKMKFHWMLWWIDDSASSAPGRFNFAYSGVAFDPPSGQFYSSQPALFRRTYAWWDYNIDLGTYRYKVNILDPSGNPLPGDPSIFNDGG